MMRKDINRFSALLGCERTLTPMKAARAVQVLGKCYRYTFHDEEMNEIGKEVLSEAEFIVFTLQDGWQPKASVDRRCDKCTKNRCIGDDACTKGKAVYHMWGRKLGNGITKMGYNFALWLMSEGLTSFETVQARIDAENALKEAAAQEANRLEQKQVEAETAEQLAKNEYESWLREAVKNYGGIGTPEGAKILIQRDIFLDLVGNYSDHAKELLVQIDNIENPHCRSDIISCLHNGNVASIKTFEHITGIKLAKAYKERIAQLKSISKADFSEEPTQYRPGKTEKDGYSSVFYKLQHKVGGTGTEFVEARGQLWNYSGFDFYITVCGEESKIYTVTEGKTGLSVGSGETLSEAQSITREFVNGMRSGKPLQTPFAVMVQQAIDKYGISPLYTQQIDLMI